MTPALAGQRIVVTRPAHQAQALCALIEQLGGVALRLPTLAIQAHAAALPTAAINSDKIIFVSANAVHYGVPLLAAAQVHAAAAYIAIGQKTQQALQAVYAANIVCPPSPFNSEALLAMPMFASVHAQTITLVKGVGGRSLLNTALSARGATVFEFPVYQRCAPQQVDASILREIQQGRVDSVIISSQAGLDQLVALVGLEVLFGCALLLGSQRQADYARSLGCRHVAALVAPNDQAYVAQLLRSARH